MGAGVSSGAGVAVGAGGASGSGSGARAAIVGQRLSVRGGFLVGHTGARGFFRVGGRPGGGGKERLDELSVRVELFIGEGGQRGKKQRQKQGKAAFHGHLMPRRES